MKLIRFFPLLFLCPACGNNSGDSTTSEINSLKIADTFHTSMLHTDSSDKIVAARAYYLWEVNAAKKTLRKNPLVAVADANIDSVIFGLNLQYEDIIFEKAGLKKDTLQLKINDSNFLTNQMGSGGQARYLAQAVINLTSIPGIKYVQIDFKEGNHAVPVTWSRKDFPGYIIVQ